MTRRGSEWSLITRVGELVTAELINTPRRDTVNPTRITDRDAPHTSNDPWPITRARNLIFKNVHTVLHMHACTHVRGSGLKNSGHSSPLIYHFLRFPPMAASLLWWQAVANAITLLEREREGGGRGEREKEETFNNIITKEKREKKFSLTSSEKKIWLQVCDSLLFRVSSFGWLPIITLLGTLNRVKWREEEEGGGISIK